MPYIGEIRMFGGNFPPLGWELCNGQPLAISDFDTLFSIIGTTYGGDGQETFNLPNLQSRIPIHAGRSAGPGLTYRQIAETLGTESETLSTQQLPIHNHPALAVTGAGNHANPDGNLWAASSLNHYSATAPGQNMNAANLAPIGGSQPHENMMPSLAVNFIIATDGIFPAENSGGPDQQPFIAELKIVAFNYPPNGWAMCDGALLPINQNQALFSILGTTYGGNGSVNFGLPDLRGRAPVHTDFSQYTLGQKAGQEAHTLSISEMPQHNHIVQASSANANATSPTNNTWGVQTANPYSNGAANTALAPGAISNSGGSQPHNNMQPSLALHIVIALQGIFPSRN